MGGSALVVDEFWKIIYKRSKTSIFHPNPTYLWPRQPPPIVVVQKWKIARTSSWQNLGLYLPSSRLYHSLQQFEPSPSPMVHQNFGAKSLQWYAKFGVMCYFLFCPHFSITTIFFFSIYIPFCVKIGIKSVTIGNALKACIKQ